MIDPLLEARLRPLWRRHRRMLLARRLAQLWLGTALVALACHALQRWTGLPFTALAPILGALALAAAPALWLRARRQSPDWRSLAVRIEKVYPELEGRLLTAVEQEVPEGHGPGYLQERLLREVLEQERRADWRRVWPVGQVAWAQAAQALALAFFALVFWNLRPEPGTWRPWATLAAGGAAGVTIVPGDTELERGDSLVVMARFSGPLPDEVTLVVGRHPETAQRIPLVRSLSDPMFGGTVPEVTEDLVYHVEYADQRTRDFHVKVFEYPRLEKADAELAYPEYTGLGPKRIENTRRISAVQGTRLTLDLQLNKPVRQAELVPVDAPDQPLVLQVSTNQAAASLREWPLEFSRTFKLRLVDAEGRTNKLPAQFVMHVLTNRPPEIKLVRPRGDLRPSPLEEVSFEGTIWDDFGVQAYGLAYTIAGQPTRVIQLGDTVARQHKQTFQHLLRLEDLGVKPDQLVAWYVWADDLGPDGRPRRTAGDMFFAEIRPFEEIFRENTGGGGQQNSQNAQQNGQGQGSPAEQLAELQKQIINATWRLQREQGLAAAASVAGTAEKSADLGRQSEGRTADKALSPQYVKDAVVVRDSQVQAVEQAQTARERMRDPRSVGFLQSAIESMQTALEQLKRATNAPAALPEALVAEQAAYQALLRLQQHEYQVSRSRQARGGRAGRNSRQAQMHRQLDQLDLRQSANRYETERQAQPPQTAQRREQLQILNRLRELARRQQDLNERLQELQTALQEARTAQEREQIRRQLRRLQEQQRQMLDDVDELAQQMDRARDRSRLAEQRQQLEQARQEMQQAAEAAGQGQVSQALASGTRAQRRMQQMREELRRENAGALAEELRDMRAQARELALQQQNIRQALQELDEPSRRRLSDAEQRQALFDQLLRQQGRMTNLVQQAREVSQQAEAGEPLVARELYDALRQLSQNDLDHVKRLREQLLREGMLTRSLYDRLRELEEEPAARTLQALEQMLREGYERPAESVEQLARADVEDFKRGIERAAERVLGDDTEALRLAREQLDQLARELEQEMARAQGRTGAEEGRQSENAVNRPGPAQNQNATNAQARLSATGEGRRALSNALARLSEEQQARQARSRQGDGRERNATRSPRGEIQLAQNDNSEQNQAARGGQRSGDRNPASSAASRGSSGERSQQAQAANRNQSQRQDNSGRSTAEARDRSSRAGRPSGAPQIRDDRLAGPQRGGRGGRGGRITDNFDWLFNEPGLEGTGPLTGEEFAPWSDRLREVEEMVEFPSLRDRIAQARDRARRMRLEFKRDLKKPDWAVVRLEILNPLVEVSRALAEELARREPSERMVPIDRDPVPPRFSELVRRYYEELGKDR